MAAHGTYQTLLTLADGSRLVRHENGVIYHHARGKNGTGRQTTGRQVLSEAVDVVRKWEIMAARVAGGSRDFVTFNEVADEYRAWLRKMGKTACQEPFLRILGRFFDGVPVCLISAEKVEEFMAWRHAGNGANSPATWARKKRVRGQASAASVYREVGVLESMLRWAHKYDKVPDSTKLSFPKGVPGQAREVFLEQDEIADLLARAAATSTGQPRLTRVHRFVWLSLFTGARSTALEQLEWSQVDFARGTIHLMKPGARATRKRRPPVPILDALMPLLVTARAQAVDGYVLDQGLIRSSWVTFVKTTPYHRDRDLHAHDLRRSFITMLVTNGMPLAEISLVYQISLNVLMKHYAKRVRNLGSRVNGYVTVQPVAPAPVVAQEIAA